MPTYLAIIALLNIALGFVLAVYVVPPPALASALGGVVPRLRFRRKKKETVAQASFEPEEEPEIAIVEDNEDEELISCSQPVQEETPEPIIEAIAEKEDTQPEVTQATLDDPSPSNAKSAIFEAEAVEQIPSGWLETLEEYGIQAASLVEASAQVLRLEVSAYREHLVELDTRLRSSIPTTDASLLQTLIVELEDINNAWVAKQSESTDHLASRTSGEQANAGVSHRLLEILENQQSQIETTLSNIKQLDILDNTANSSIRILTEIRKLLDLAHGLRDRMYEVLLEIKKTEDRLSELEPSLLKDGLTQLTNRAGLEKILYEQFLTTNGRLRQVCCVLVDIDRFSVLMDKYGALICDRILTAFGNFINGHLRHDRGFDLTARIDGQRFVMLLADTGPRGAMSAAERIRQQLKFTTFEYGDQLIEFTMRSGVAELGPEETADEFFDRLEAAVAIATTLGRDCTAIDEGQGPKTLDPPHYEVDGRIISLT